MTTSTGTRLATWARMLRARRARTHRTRRGGRRRHSGWGMFLGRGGGCAGTAAGPCSGARWGTGQSSDGLLGVSRARHHGQTAQPQPYAVYPDEGRHPLRDEAVTSDQGEKGTGRGRLPVAAGDGGHDPLAVAVERHRHVDGPGLEDEADGILPAGVVEGGDVEGLAHGRRAVVVDVEEVGVALAVRVVNLEDDGDERAVGTQAPE